MGASWLKHDIKLNFGSSLSKPVWIFFNNITSWLFNWRPGLIYASICVSNQYCQGHFFYLQKVKPIDANVDVFQKHLAYEIREMLLLCDEFDIVETLELSAILYEIVNSILILFCYVYEQ